MKCISYQEKNLYMFLGYKFLSEVLVIKESINVLLYNDGLNYKIPLSLS